MIALENRIFETTRKLDLSDIIQNEWIEPFFQPIVSVKQKRIVGFEALMRGIDPDTSAIIPPMSLLHYAHQHDLACNLQRIMHQKALEKFIKLSKAATADNPLFLTLNCDTFLVGDKLCALSCILDLMKRYNVDRNRIILEIVESEIANRAALERFNDIVKRAGFLIALDDMGAGHSNLDRMAALKPDIIKLDRFLLKNIQNEYHKQEVVKAVINLAHKTGALVIGEGVEFEEEVIYSLNANVDMLQGFYFGLPNFPEDISFDQMRKQLKYLEWIYHRSFKNRSNKKRDILQSYDTVVSHMTSELSECSPNDFDGRMRERVSRQSSFECIYILDENGRQITETIAPSDRPIQPKNMLYQPAPKGADHSNKEFFYQLSIGINKFITDPYVSLASGNFCITISVVFMNDGRRYILCIDAIPDYLYT